MTTEEPGLDLGALMGQLGQMQQSLQAAQESAASTVVVGSAGGGAVKVTTTGGLDIQSVTINPSVVDPEDVSMLEDLVLAAIRDAVEQVEGLRDQALGGLSGLLGGGLPGQPGEP
ncbi:MAG: YbaB/EbfC family nucleoid-associated protein [Acidimicrobiaceae bacterium]|nr:YbaB/EbfC family nucleoid-associated protein [Acidimicrobiaceae bacterium]